MTDYKKLAAYYLKASKKRCVITIIGVMITVIVLYAGLNIFYSYMLQQQKDVRKEADYEIVFLTDDQETLSQIASDDRVTQAYTGKYAVSEWETVNGTDGKYVEKVYDNALYVNTGHPYRMAKIMNEMIEDYGVDAELNWNLSTWYLQDMEEGFAVILIVVLLIAYIFAIFAVGVIRNTIQMFTLEQVKDYGILRCIGATKGQLSGIIYRMGAMLEIAGLLAGIVMGGIVSMILGFIFKISAGFHIIPMIPILITYLGDMYFVMRENAKLVTKMTPVSAVRGEYRIKKEKLRRHGGGLMGKIFGIEGAYARKSVLRNKGRFIKTVTAMVFSISVIVLICSCWGQLRKYWKSTDERYGDYQINLTSYSSSTTSLEEAQSTLPSVEVFRELSRNNSVEESKKVYGCKADLVDTDSYTGKITDEFRTKVTMGHYYGVYMDKLNGTGEASDDKDPEVTRSVAETMVNSTDVIGCDDSDLNHLAKYLTAGTTELSENGILVVAGGSFNSWDLDGDAYGDEADTLYDKIYHFETYHFELGDTVQLVDFALYQKKCLKAKERIEQEFEKLQKEAGMTQDSGEIENAEGRTAMRQEYVEYEQIRDQLIAEGHYKTYKVEGILDLGTQVFGETADRQIYMRQNDYFDLTGYGENDIAGMKYKVNLDSVSASSVTDMLSYIGDSLYGESMQLCVYLKSFVRYAIAAVLFIFVLSSVNIVNTTAGNLHLRRKEFAQLRVIGMSRKRLLKTVMLEGVMTTVVANVLGFIIGIGLSYGVFMYLNMVIEAGKSIAWWAFGVGLVASGLIICGSIWLGIRDLPVAMVEDLRLEE
jgi:ABC-type antimicrobial peptide transport system permease subunit